MGKSSLEGCSSLNTRFLKVAFLFFLTCLFLDLASERSWRGEEQYRVQYSSARTWWKYSEQNRTGLTAAPQDKTEHRNDATGGAVDEVLADRSTEVLNASNGAQQTGSLGEKYWRSVKSARKPLHYAGGDRLCIGSKAWHHSGQLCVVSKHRFCHCTFELKHTSSQGAKSQVVMRSKGDAGIEEDIHENL